MALFETIKNEVRDKIISGDIRVGEKAPSIKNLCNDYSVSHVTALRVLKDLAQDGYIIQKTGRGYFVNRINANGRSAERKQLIACVLRPCRQSSLTDNYFNDIIQAIQKSCMQKRFNIHYPHQSLGLDQDFTDSKFWAELLDSCLEIADKVDGYFLDERIPDPIIRKFTNIINKPCVLVGRKTLADIDSVFPDNSGGAANAAKMCVQMDYKRFWVAHDAYHADNYNLSERTKSFIKALKKNGVSDKNITEFDFNIIAHEDTFASLEKNIEPKVKTLFFSPTDRFARWLVNAMFKENIPVGDKVGIFGFGGQGFAKNFKPQLTTIDVDPAGIGTMAVEVLMQRISSEKHQGAVNRSPEAIFYLGETI